ncbi:MAG TPA: hypothetical protein VFF28_06905 [Candidatus Nanoarchaeia archaeon]|nr:hypothetical protein [Candidatus Nanoarchaeia archaeon]
MRNVVVIYGPNEKLGMAVADSFRDRSDLTNLFFYAAQNSRQLSDIEMANITSTARKLGDYVVADLQLLILNAHGAVKPGKAPLNVGTFGYDISPSRGVYPTELYVNETPFGDQPYMRISAIVSSSDLNGKEIQRKARLIHGLLDRVARQEKGDVVAALQRRKKEAA